MANACSMADLGEYFGATLYAREVDYMLTREWAQTADDILYRRTKTGLAMTAAQREALARFVDARRATS
jgi:glycerol-3-phosphate dehydrogenase